MSPTQNPQDGSQPQQPAVPVYSPAQGQAPQFPMAGLGPAVPGSVPSSQPLNYGSPQPGYGPANPAQPQPYQAQSYGQSGLPTGQQPAGSAYTPSPQPQAYTPAPAAPTPPLKPLATEYSDKPDPSRYDFFLNPEKPSTPKKSLLPSSGGSGLGLGKILVITGVIFGVLAILAIVLSATRGSSGPPPILSSLTTNQQEIIHTTTAAGKTLESASLQNFAITAKMSTTSAQQAYIAFLNTRGVSVDGKQLAAVPFTNIDTVLETAKTANTYDATFKTTMQTILTKYQNKLQQAVSASTGQSERAILTKNLDAAKLLQVQLAQQDS